MNKCMQCDQPATLQNTTQFAGTHYWCDAHVPTEDRADCTPLDTLEPRYITIKIDKGCNILDSINVIEENNTYTNAGFLNDTLIDVEAFRGLNCYEALERLLYP